MGEGIIFSFCMAFVQVELTQLLWRYKPRALWYFLCPLIAVMIQDILFDLMFVSICLCLTAVKSLLELIPYLLSIPGVKVFLSERLSQDPLERFFGQRQRGGTHENPTVQEFYKNTQALRVINSFCVGTVKRNCRGRLEAQDVEDKKQSTTREIKILLIVTILLFVC